MSRYEYTDAEREINAVLANQERQLKSLSMPDTVGAEEAIAKSETLLVSLGYDLPGKGMPSQSAAMAAPARRQAMTVPTWDEVMAEALDSGCEGAGLEDLFSEGELTDNAEAVRLLNAEYDQVHRLDALDVAIAVGAGLLSAAVDILLVGIPEKTAGGLKAAPLSGFIRDHIEGAFTPQQVAELEKAAKVPYDAPINKGFTETRVEGLFPGMHRLYSLGHDPLLGLVVGTSDILTGRMTTIDKNGRVVSQVIERYADRAEADVFGAVAKQLTHFLSDVSTPAGLPVPCMALFDLMKFGSIGEEEATIAEVVQGMYWGGYDFAHFCSMSMPVAVAEAFVRFAYALKRRSEGVPLKDAASLSASREKCPKLPTMLFLAHASAAAVNAGKVWFSVEKSPMAINYPQWVAFAKYSYRQLKWALIEKSEARDRYVRGIVAGELEEVYSEVGRVFGELCPEAIVV